MSLHIVWYTITYNSYIFLIKHDKVLKTVAECYVLLGWGSIIIETKPGVKEGKETGGSIYVRKLSI